MILIDHKVILNHGQHKVILIEPKVILNHGHHQAILSMVNSVNYSVPLSVCWQYLQLNQLQIIVSSGV